MTEQVHIKKDGTIDPDPVKLGGSYEHQVDWHNSGDKQVLVIISPEVGEAIFSNPPDQKILIGGGGNTGPATPLVLLPHEQRQKGDFNYHIQIGDNQPVMCTFKIEP